LARTGLYHSIRLPDGRILEGAMPLAYQTERWESFGLPEDLSGWKALDIGPWDGYFTFELERHGADVTAIDYVDLDTFRKLHALMGSRAQYRKLDVYDLRREELGEFDVVLLLGVLYHLKHPLLALERICAVTREFCIIETHVVDSEAYREGRPSPIPYAEFYERGELGGQLDNWCGPTVSQVLAWVRAAGFARATVLKVTDTTVRVRADRRWRGLGPSSEPAFMLRGVNSPAHGGRCFRSQQEEYLNFWLEWSSPAPPALESIYPEVDGFGVAPIYSELTPHGAMVTTRLPVDLTPGEHACRLRAGDSGWSNEVPIYVDPAPVDTQLVIAAIQDAIGLQTDEVDWANGGWMTLWIEGLSELADAGSVTVEIDGVPHRPQAVAGGQVNVQLRPLFDGGEHRVAVAHRGARSAAHAFVLKGRAAPIKGFEGIG